MKKNGGVDMGYYFRRFQLKMKKDLQKRANKLRFRRTMTGKNGGVVWKSKFIDLFPDFPDDLPFYENVQIPDGAFVHHSGILYQYSFHSYFLSAELLIFRRFG